MTYDPEPGGAVVIAPAEAGGGPGTVLVALVRVDGWGVEHHQLGDMGHPTAEEPPELVGAVDRAKNLVAREGIALTRPETHMEMAGRSRLRHVWLGHEGDGDPGAVGDLLHRLLHDGVPVGHVEKLGETDVHLVLALAPLALGILDWNPRSGQVTSHLGVVELLAAPLQEVVVLDVPTGRSHPVVLLLSGLPIASPRRGRTRARMPPLPCSPIPRRPPIGDEELCGAPP